MTWEQIPVSIRLSSSNVSRECGRCTDDDLDDLVDIVKPWEMDGREVTAQFRPDLGCFEIIVHDE